MKGGKRKGAGRPKGRKNTKSQLIAQKAAEEGVTPLEIMLKAMREFAEQADAFKTKGKTIETDGKKVITRLGLLQSAAAVAKDAAPYIHPRLAAIEHTGKDGESLGSMTPVINLTVGKG